MSRPLSSGWLSLAAGGRVDTTFVVVDRSPSMLQKGQGTPQSKLEAGLGQLKQALGLLRSNRWVLIDSINNQPIEFESPEALDELVEVQPTSASADIPSMLETVSEYIHANSASRSEVWILSDVRKNDWDADSGRWQVIKDSILELPQTVRFHLLAYPQIDGGNRAIRVTDVRRVETSDGAELLLSLRIQQSEATEGTAKVPVQIEIGGGRSEFSVDLTGTETEIKNHVIPLDGQTVKGWGRVSLPADANPSDNEYYFTFDQSPVRKTVIVTDDPQATRALAVAASIPAEDGVKTDVETVSESQLDTVEWDKVSLLLWHANLPQGALTRQVESFAKRGGEVIFFPPESPDDSEFAGVKWAGWQNLDQETPIATWTGDRDLLANTRSGASLPVGQLKVYRYCELEGNTIALASLDGGTPLLSISLPPKDEADGPGSPELAAFNPYYFCATTPGVGESSLARDGIVLYVMIQRALASGAGSLGNAREFIAGAAPETVNQWNRVAGSIDGLSTSHHVLAGVYEGGERLSAINRSESEDADAIVEESQVAGLFQGLEFDRVDDQVGSGSSLLSEIWRLFLMLMMAALLLEAALCIPRQMARETNSVTPTPTTAERGMAA
ncbi:MAG: hypothetical protein KDA80_19635 [Planctomycetaceae bacterium]|nr:hypothetical protein [Planctomycetaceae bacterium]